MMYSWIMCKQGGNLIMQYNQLDQDMAKIRIGPYSFKTLFHPGYR